MATQAPVRTGQQAAARAQVAEREARSISGMKILVGGMAVVIAAIVVFVIAGKQTGATQTALVWVGSIALIATFGLLSGLTPVVRVRRVLSSCSATTAARPAIPGCSG